MKECFIFLDVDGPINTHKNILQNKLKNKPTSSYRIKLPTRQLERLATIVRETNAKLILSSSWRLVNLRHSVGNISPARRNLESQLNLVGLSLSGQTPFIGSDRGLEINTWLDKYEYYNGYRPAYIIIDDNIDKIIRQHRGHIIYCDPNYGITDKEMNIAINLLLKQMEK